MCVSVTVVLVLVQPLVAVLSEQFVLSERRINKAIYERRGKVHTGRVHLRAAATES